MHRFPDAVIIHQGDALHPVPVRLQHRERNAADRQRDQAVRDARGAVELFHPARREGAVQLGRARRLDAPDRRGALRRLESHHYARDQAAAPPRHHTVATSGRSSTISSATVAWPATTSWCSKGGTTARRSRAAISSAFTRRSSEVLPAKTTSPPHFFTPSTFTAGAVSGITITARTPNFCAAQETAWPWLPEEKVITPRRRAASGSLRTAL